MKLIVLFVLFGIVSTDLSSEWNQFKRKYKKQYASDIEENQRRQIFFENVNRMHNFQQNHPDATFKVAINHLTDRRIEEIVSGRKHSVEAPSMSKTHFVDVRKYPESLDWRTKGVISPPRDQGLSGEIETAIVSTELVETLYAIHNKELIEGSVFRVFDCCPQPADAFECMRNMGGLCRQSDYPTALGVCKPNQCQPFVNFTTINRLPPGDQNTMMARIQESSLWAELDATGEGFALYSEGVYDDSTCSEKVIDHVMQIVGYGTDGGIPYWLCKNSWGDKWGEKGYIRMVRGKNLCGIESVVIQVADPYPHGNSAIQLKTIGLINFLFVVLIVYFQIEE